MDRPRWVTVEKRKWDGQVSGRWRALLVSCPPEPWVWHLPEGTCHERPWRDRRAPTNAPQVVVAVDEGWLLTLELDDAGAPVSAEADAMLPVREDPDGVVSFVDLDLDLEIDLRDGSAELKDEDDFRRRCVQMGYPVPVQRAAWRGLGTIRRRLAAREWPFGPAMDGLVTGALAAARGTPPPA